MSISSGLLGYGNRERLLRRVEQMSSAGFAERVQAQAFSDEQTLYARTEVYVKALLTELLKVPLERFESEIAFSEYGLDSILITRFNGRLAKDLPDVSKTLLFEYSNAAAVSRYLVEGHRAELEVLFAEAGSKSEASVAAPVASSIYYFGVRQTRETPRQSLSAVNLAILRSSASQADIPDPLI